MGVLLWKIRQVMSEFPRDYQVLLADDGSTDATPEVLAPYTRVLPLTIYRHETRHGYAASIEKLLREVVRLSDYPRRDIIVTLQADFTDEPEEIPTLVRRIEGGADVVTGALSLGEAKAPRSVRWTHKLLGYLVRRRRWPEGVTDPLSGFRAYRVVTVKKALAERNGGPLVEGEGWVANVELLRLVVPHARRVDEEQVSVRYDRRFRETRFRPWETIRGILALLRLAPKAPSREAAPAGGDDWEELKSEDSLAESARRERPDRTRKRGGGRGRGRARPEREVRQRDEARQEAGARRSMEVEGPRGARAEAEEAVAGAAGSEERRGREGGEERRRRSRGGGDRRRRGGDERRRRPRAEGGAESAAAQAEGGEGTEQGGGKASPDRQQRRRPRRRRRPSGAEARGGGGGETAAAAPESGGDRESEGDAAAGNGRRPPRRRGGSRGRRRGGRRTGTGSSGRGGEETSSGPATEE